jgi:3-phenylpropionate/trans-cinnamate dioxygenase ferredoxin subunit
MTDDGFECVTGAVPAPGELRAARLADGSAVCVGNIGDALFAIRDECSHAGFPLSEGSLLADGVLECAWHGARFDCRTGRSLDEPPFDSVERFDLRVSGGAIWVRRAAPARETGA